MTRAFTLVFFLSCFSKSHVNEAGMRGLLSIFLHSAQTGIELGIADQTLMKAIAQTTGRTLAQIKADAQESGDLGIVAERSKSNQRMMFQPAKLSVRSVFDKLKDIALMSGKEVNIIIACVTNC